MGAGLLQPGDLAFDFILPEVATGEPRTLSSRRGRAVVLLFYRGPWCGVCHQHLGKVRKRLAEIQELGAEVVAVYPGKVEHLRPHVLESKVPFPVLADEGSAVIDLYGVRNRWALFHRGIPHPATYVIDRDGVVRFADVRHQHFFRIPVGTLVAQVRALGGAPSGR
jgi:peroxiredoxin